jgi:exonuclease VII small subunit
MNEYMRMADRMYDLENQMKQLEKENAKLKEAIEGYKKIAKWCDKCDKIAELKSENQKWKDEWQDQVQKATDEGYARTLQTIQLSKAKQFIRDFLSVAVDYIDKEDKNYSYIEEGWQFLKDSEVEK